MSTPTPRDMPLREIVVRSAYALVGVAVLGLGAAVLLVGGLGVDPFTALNTGISDLIGWDLGTTQLVTNALLFAAVWVFGRNQIGPGTVINMVLTGYFIGWFSDWLAGWVPEERTLFGAAIFFAIGLVIFDFGASAYISAGVGTAPYDAIAPIIVERTSWKYRNVRAVQDLACVAGAVLVGGQVGVGTVVTAFFNGPLIEHYSEKFNSVAVERLVRATGGASTAQHRTSDTTQATDGD
ncbi:hypothetical protein EK0264_08620 [Epidermidibacterium keratini]|uniref:YitT family protein n=1 Tax=Epidermidibacterium keratini TaxID=1891644 RepID=A0A7L4YP50_9ACTN|nr:YitT family protein [Epidermidibacterium keratini]QHC00337.1 hypothetical protein EK0264_08620 [Epidermidibacterium keratini]